MSEETRLSQSTWGKNNEDQIGEDLEKLFVFQDKHLSKDKRAILVKALLESNIPIGAVLLGIRKLMNDDLSSIKMGTIFAAARSFMEPAKVGQGCQDCANGIVTMRDEEGRWFSLACQCGQGFNIKSSLGLKTWGGESSQLSRSRTLTKVT